LGGCAGVEDRGLAKVHGQTSKRQSWLVVLHLFLFSNYLCATRQHAPSVPLSTNARNDFFQCPFRIGPTPDQRTCLLNICTGFFSARDWRRIRKGGRSEGRVMQEEIRLQTKSRLGLCSASSCIDSLTTALSPVSNLPSPTFGERAHSQSAPRVGNRETAARQ
jgi:hypothetical protein